MLRLKIMLLIELEKDVLSNMLVPDSSVEYLNQYVYLANPIHCPNAGSMLVQRLRRWPNIDQTLGQSLVFVEYVYYSHLLIWVDYICLTPSCVWAHHLGS